MDLALSEATMFAVVAVSVVIAVVLMVIAHHRWRAIEAGFKLYPQGWQDEIDRLQSGVGFLVIAYGSTLALLGWIVLVSHGLASWVEGWRYAWLGILPVALAALSVWVAINFNRPSWSAVGNWAIFAVISCVLCGLTFNWWLVVMALLPTVVYHTNFSATAEAEDRKVQEKAKGAAS